MPNLKVADNLELPIGFVTQKAALLARSGAGKTNTAVDIVEELLEAQQQCVILDPPGAWWGLQEHVGQPSRAWPDCLSRFRVSDADRCWSSAGATISRVPHARGPAPGVVWAADRTTGQDLARAARQSPGSCESRRARRAKWILTLKWPLQEHAGLPPNAQADRVSRPHFGCGDRAALPTTAAWCHLSGRVLRSRLYGPSDGAARACAI